jgi:hypothetical protein
VLSADYFSVHATAEFGGLAPAPIPVMPQWSPVAKFGGYANPPEGAGCGCAVF